MASARHPQRTGRFTSTLSILPLAFAVAVVCGPVATAWGQLPRTRLTSVTPPVGQVGKTVEVTIAGADIDEVSAMSFSHAGIKAVQKTTESGGKKTPVANTFVVTVGKDVAPGLYDARVSGLFGGSNPMAFAVTSREVGCYHRAEWEERLRGIQPPSQSLCQVASYTPAQTQNLPSR